jgi:hypothetical protein
MAPHPIAALAGHEPRSRAPTGHEPRSSAPAGTLLTALVSRLVCNYPRYPRRRRSVSHTTRSFGHSQSIFSKRLGAEKACELVSRV